MRSEFFEMSDVADERRTEQLLDLVDQDYRDQGRVLASFRPWPTRRVWTVTAVLLGLCLLPILLVPGDTGWGLTFTGLVSVGGTFLTFLLAGVVDHHRVCEHGLVVGFRRRSRYVVPWCTLDPGRVRVVERSSLLGRYPEVASTSPHFRQGFLTTRSLAVNGLDTAQSGWVRIPGLLDVSDVVDQVSGARGTPFTWWLLGARQPERLAEAIEEAMVADGYAAQGLARRASAEAVTLRWNPPGLNPLPSRQATDPVLGVDGPSLPQLS